MKHLILSLSCLFYCFGAFAQLPVWTIRPDYDALEMKLDNELISTDSAGVTSIWSLDGKRLFTTRDKVMPYSEGHAAVVNSQNAILGILDSKGRFTKIEGYSVAYADPYFHNGYMLCATQNGFEYIDTDGSKAEFAPAVRPYPFRCGFAPYMMYDQPDKLKDPHYRYYNASGDVVRFMLKGKKVENKNVQFLSGIAPNGKGVAVIDDKLYWFDSATAALSPLLAGPETDSEKKRHVELDGDYEDLFKYPPISREIEINCKYGKKQVATLKFGQDLVPRVFSFNGEVMSFEETAKEDFAYTSPISCFGDDKKGLSYKEINVLPEQFDAVGIAYGDRAIVKHGGKWGVINIKPDLSLKLTMNKGEDIPFRHHKYSTQIRLDFPADISTRELRLDIPDDTGCELDRTSRTAKDTEYGNFVQYDCTLTIPSNLPDSITPIIYHPVKISYDGLRLPDRPLAVKAWHLKYFNVDPIDSETAVKDGIATFTVNIDAQRTAGDQDYPFEVKIVSDSAYVNYEKLSETRYKCIVSNLQEGLNHMSVMITEKGCPPSRFPFEISYTKPVEKMALETVSIRKISDLDMMRLPSLETPAILSPLAPESRPEAPADDNQTPAETEQSAEAELEITPARQQPVDPLAKMVLGL